MVIFIFLKFGMVKLFETLQTISKMKMNIFQKKIFNEITLLVFIIYSFIKFKVLVSLPKSFHDPLGMRMHCNWPTDHATVHSSIGLKRLTIQPVFNEVSLFTFSKGTHGFDITVPKNYLKNYLNGKSGFAIRKVRNTNTEEHSHQPIDQRLHQSNLVFTKLRELFLLVITFQTQTDSREGSAYF